MHDAQLHDNEASNVWRVLQRLKNYIKDQKGKSSTTGTLPHPNGTIVWNVCLMRSETRVGRITGYAHSQGVKSIKKSLQKLIIFTL